MNPYVVAARTRKAVKLADTLSTLIAKTGASVDELAELPHDAWVTVSTLAKVNVPSDETKAEVLDLLRRRVERVAS